MSRGLLVDFGGVLTTNVFESFRAFCEAEGLEPNTVKEMFRSRGEGLGLLRQLERGELTVEEFEPLFADVLGIGERSEGMVERLFAGVGPDERMVSAVRAARGAGVPTGLISNSWGQTTYDQELIDELFDVAIISGDVGMHKPEPEIFHLGAERLGVPAADCVFVDDLRENCEGAEAVGMTAILHRGADSTLPEMERLLGVPVGAEP
ncbi:MAG: putative hydrolase of the superfamily [Thermoleophilaceae bacterium]|nr:putative hydrolase of the superfamily [Thermoleophilaceae bacterium]